MFIKIYFDNKPLFLCDAIDESIQPIIHHDDAVFIDELNLHTVKTMIHEMGLPHVHAGVFYNPDLEQLKRAFYKKFTLVQAAGGLVQNGKKELLLIFRRGNWDLPKGKLDKGETIENCAVREVQEETGLIKVKLLNQITITRHTYNEGSRVILKESHWFSMEVKGNPALIPQLEEQITEAKWVNKKDLQFYINNSYASVADVLQLYT